MASWALFDELDRVLRGRTHPRFVRHAVGFAERDRRQAVRIHLVGHATTCQAAASLLIVDQELQAFEDDLL